MKKFRCQLCGGKIQNGRCSLCGWINQENREYILNKGRCDNKPLTHVHEEETFGSWGGSEMQAKLAEHRVKLAQQRHTKVSSKPRSVSMGNRPRSVPQKRTKKKLNIGIVIFVLVILISFIVEFVPEITGLWFGESTAVSSSEYENVMYDLPEDGEEWTEEFTAGIYTVGVDIPEGIYQVKTTGGDGSFNLADSNNSIYLYEWFSEEDTYDEARQMLENVRLYRGAEVELSDSIQLQFHTENGNTDLQEAANPLTESVTLKENEGWIVGVDFPGGTYDIVIEDGWGTFVYEIPYSAKEDVYEYDSKVLDSDYGSDRFYHLVLTDGTRVHTESADMMLVPSDRVVPDRFL